MTPMLLMRGRFGCGVHAVLRHFVDAARGRLLMRAIKMVEGARSLPNGETVFDSFQHIGFRKHYRFPQAASQSELGGNR